jgi:hypothetical protein
MPRGWKERETEMKAESGNITIAESAFHGKIAGIAVL